MSFLTQGKTNWKYVLIVLILAVIVGGGILGWIKRTEIPSVEFPKITRPEKPGKVEGDIEKYLHKDAILRGVEMPPEAKYQAISTKEAILIVAQNLENQNVKDIKIRHLLWVVAPRGEFFIAGDCNFIHEGKQYNKFLAVIEDGSEGEVGKPSFVFKDTDIWYSNLAPSALPEELEELVGEYESLAKIHNVIPIFKSSEIKDETANWKTYSNPEVDFTFKYPPDWEIKQEYQYKSAACQADPNCKGVRYIFLNRIDDTRPANMGEKDKFGMAINMPQCTGVKRSDLPGNNWICVFDEKSETLEIFNQMLSTFTLY